MLEQQQAQLVAALRELYQRLQTGRSWPGPPLQEAQGGHPLTHDILERLDLLHSAGDGSSNYEGFKEDCSRLQRRLLNNGAVYMCRRASISSNSEHGFASSTSSLETPASQLLRFSNSFVQDVAPPTPPTPPTQSPLQRQPHLASAVQAFPQFMRPSIIQTDLNPANVMRSQWVTQAPSIDDSLSFLAYDLPVSFDEPTPFNCLPTTANSPLAMTEWTSHEVDFSDSIRA